MSQKTSAYRPLTGDFIETLKKHAKKLAKTSGIRLHASQDLIAQQYGYESWSLLMSMNGESHRLNPLLLEIQRYIDKITSGQPFGRIDHDEIIDITCRAWNELTSLSWKCNDFNSDGGAAQNSVAYGKKRIFMALELAENIFNVNIGTALEKLKISGVKENSKHCLYHEYIKYVQNSWDIDYVDDGDPELDAYISEMEVLDFVEKELMINVPISITELNTLVTYEFKMDNAIVRLCDSKSESCYEFVIRHGKRLIEILTAVRDAEFECSYLFESPALDHNGQRLNLEWLLMPRTELAGFAYIDASWSDELYEKWIFVKSQWPAPEPLSEARLEARGAEAKEHIRKVREMAKNLDLEGTSSYDFKINDGDYF